MSTLRSRACRTAFSVSPDMGGRLFHGRSPSISTRTLPPGSPVTEATRPSTPTLFPGTAAHDGQAGGSEWAEKVRPKPRRKAAPSRRYRNGRSLCDTTTRRRKNATPSITSRRETDPASAARRSF